jgi:hypothetical protein
MERKEAVAVLQESKRQNEIMRDNPSTFFTSKTMASGVNSAKKRIAALDMAIAALSQPNESLTNADRIRAMSDEELLDFLKKSVANAYMCKIMRTDPMFLTLGWLQQPAEEGVNLWHPQSSD